MIYPKLSPNGLNVAAGNDGIFINGVPAPPLAGDDRSYGSGPVWANNHTIYFTYSRNDNGVRHPLDGQLVQLAFPITTSPILVGELSGNELTAGGNIYAIWRPDIGVKVSNSPVSIPGWHSPALSDAGVLAHGDMGDGTKHYAWGSTTVARERQPYTELIIDVNNPDSSWIDFTPELQCGLPVPVWTGLELFILFLTHDGMVFLMEYGSRLGYVIKPRNFDGGSGYTHDAKCLGVHHIRCVSPAFDVVVDLRQPRVEMPPLVVEIPPTEPPVDPPPVDPPTEPIDPPTIPPEEPMPTVNITYPELRNMEMRLEDTYKNHGGHPPMTYTIHVNPEGFVWREHYWTRREQGMNHEQAIRSIESDIDVIEGRPDRWATPPSNSGVPGGQLSGEVNVG